MIRWLRSIFGPPEPAGPPETIRRFQTTASTLTRSGFAVLQDAWVIESTEPQTVRLFQVKDPEADQCFLTYRVSMKTEGLSGGAYLEMWCRLPGRGEFFSKGLQQKVNGTTDWASYEVPFYLKRGQRPDLIKLNVVIEGTGKLWIKDIQLLKTPLRS